jgi:hypothetical protein
MYLGLRYLGWMGAAYGAVVSAILSFFIMYLVLNKSIGVRLYETFKYTGQSYKEIYLGCKKFLKPKL